MRSKPAAHKWDCLTNYSFIGHMGECGQPHECHQRNRSHFRRGWIFARGWNAIIITDTKITCFPPQRVEVELSGVRVWLCVVVIGFIDANSLTQKPTTERL